MLIHVTQSDIDEGKVARCYDCPVAKAMLRQLDLGHCCVEVNANYFIIKYGNISMSNLIDLPPSVISFIGDFDMKRNVKPFSFNLGPIFLKDGTNIQLK